MLDLDFASAMRLLAISFVPALLGIILHEIAHGWAAKLCGDPTAHLMGRLSLNPVSHIDPMGLAMFGITSIAGPFVFGWAKPVPVDPRYFQNPRRDMMLVSLAGPATNFLLAIAFGLLLWLLLYLMPFHLWHENVAYLFAAQSCQIGVVINFGLGWLNLVPVPPLDGSKILAYFLPAHLAWRYLTLGRYGFIILILLLFTGLLSKVLSPLISWSCYGLFGLLGLD